MSTYKPPSHMAQALEYKGPGALRGEEKKNLREIGGGEQGRTGNRVAEKESPDRGSL